MLISHKYKFITIDIPKTGTRSMRVTLEPAGVIDIVGGPYMTRDVPFEQHGSALSAKKQFIKNNWDWEKYYKWVIVRNPWERYFSFFKYYKSYREKFLRRDKSINWQDVQVNQGKLCVELFKSKDDQTVLKNIILNNNSQDSYYCDEHNEIIVDHIASFEQLSSEFVSLCNQVGIKTPSLKHGNKSSNSLNRDEIYNQQLIDLVAQKESSVIEYCNYNYE